MISSKTQIRLAQKPCCLSAPDGGFVVNNVNKKLNYLVVCDEKNTCWAFTCYGRKIEEAINIEKKEKSFSSFMNLIYMIHLRVFNDNQMSRREK